MLLGCVLSSLEINRLSLCPTKIYLLFGGHPFVSVFGAVGTGMQPICRTKRIYMHYR